MNFENIFEFFDEHLKKDKVKIINPQRINDIINAYNELISTIHVESGETSIEMQSGALELGDVFIRIVTPQFTLYDMMSFAKAIAPADNIDIYPTTDQRVKIDLMFNNVFYVAYL